MVSLSHTIELQQAELEGRPLPADERERGWPWTQKGYAAAVESWVTPWLR